MRNLHLPVLIMVLFALAASCEKTETAPGPNAAMESPNASVDFRGESYDWNFHQAPYDFLFGNPFDTHQQTKEEGNRQLNGFFYITIRGEEDGIPVADHGNCDNDPEGCTVGWMLHGIKMEAELLQKGMGHPQWYISPEKLPAQPGFTHFHWIKKIDGGESGHASGASQEETSGGHNGGLEVGATYEGYLLKLTARETFYFEHHGRFLVRPGIDYETHANVRTTH